MQKPFLFRVPGYHGMFDFEEIKGMDLPKNRVLGVTECMKPGSSRNVGEMSVAAILSKFG